MSAIFTPVTMDFGKKNMHWGKGNPFFFYPNIFVSPYTTGLNTTRDSFKGAKLIISDSGGYQLKNGTIKESELLDALDVLCWQEEIADIGLTLDLPPVTKYKIDINKWDKYLKKSVRNANIMKEEQPSNLKLFAVLQGQSYYQLETWYKAITKDHEFDGYAVPLIRVLSYRDIPNLVEQLKFIIQNLDTNIHFLGQTSPLFMLIINRLSEITGRQYYFDSATPANAMMYGDYFAPFRTLTPITCQLVNGSMFEYTFPIYRLTKLSYSLKKNKGVKLDSLGANPCNCPYCKKYTVGMVKQNKYLRYNHNVYQMVQRNTCAGFASKHYDWFVNFLEFCLTNENRFQKHSEDIIKQLDSVLS